MYGGLAALLLISLCSGVGLYLAWISFPSVFSWKAVLYLYFSDSLYGITRHICIWGKYLESGDLAFAMAGLVVAYEWVFPCGKNIFEARSYGMTVFYLLAYLF